LDKRELTFEEILEVIKLFESSSEFSEFHLKFGDTVVDLRKHGATGPGFAPTATHAPAVVPMTQPVEAPKPAAPAPAPVPGVPVSVAVSAKAIQIKSPTVGTFYSAPEPGAKPFVSVGERVTPSTTVCIVEVMKLMNAIQASCTGTVTDILVKDSEAVEFGQVMIVIEQD
jgi:acetyl-CoA carboxylase biotin carboxyl carrier protein